jgi:hypothetical protein
MHLMSIAAMLLAVSEISAVSAATCDGDVKGRSGSRVQPIVELYTSEGCDSCPPADRWFSSLQTEKLGIIPLAFHVDYWDYIGWKDRFARADFATRQRDIVRRRGGRTVYTPQVMMNGQDIRAASNSGLEAAVRDASTKPVKLELLMVAKPAGTRLDIDLQLSVLQGRAPTGAKIYLAITEGNLSSRVTAGENKGVLLKHDHVVREFVGPFDLPSADGKASLRHSLTLQPGWQREALTVVAFADDNRTGEVLQSLALPLCRR